MNLLNFNWIYWKLIQNLNRSWRYCHIPVCSMRRKWLCGRQEKKKETHSVLIAASFELIFISLPLSDYFRIQWGKNLSDISLCFMEGCALFFLRCGVVINFMECKISVCLEVLWISVDVYWEFLLILMTVAWYKSEISGGIFHSLSRRFLHKATGDCAVWGDESFVVCHSCHRKSEAYSMSHGVSSDSWPPQFHMSLSVCDKFQSEPPLPLPPYWNSSNSLSTQDNNNSTS